MAVDLKSRAKKLSARALALLSALLLAPRVQAQTTPAPAQKPCAPKPCPAPASDARPPSAAQQFPYPGDKSTETPPPPDSPTPSHPTNAPPSAVPAAPNASPAKQFPYPGDAKPAEGSRSSSSSGASSAGSNPDPDMPADPDVDPNEKSPRRRLPKVRHLQSDEDREAEDLTVARYYGDRGNWNAAYLRSKDAVKLKPDDPDAHQLLAEAAHKLNKKDEAVAEYNALLKLDASEGQIKAAHKALARLQ